MSDNGRTAPVMELTVMELWDRRVELAEIVAGTVEAEAKRLGVPIDGTTLDLIGDEIARRNRATLRRTINFVTLPPELRRALITAHGQTCVFCAGRGDSKNGPNGRPWHLDHAQPFSRGGSHATGNLALSCASCNTAKGQMTAEEFLELRKRRGEPADSGAPNERS